MKALPESIAHLNEPSEYLQEVLATPPRWIIRWGQVGVLLLVAVLFWLGWLIRYPDRIPAEIVITTPNPPVEIVARIDGPLSHLMVADQDTVAKGAVLAIIENAARYEDIIQLQEQLDKLLATDFSWVIADTLLINAYQLGILQTPYAQVQQASKDYALYLQLAPHYQEQLAVARQLRRYESLLRQGEQQQRLLNKKVALAEKDYRRNEQLHSSATIADKTLEESEQEWLAVREVYEALLAEQAQVKVQVAGLQREWQKLETQHTQTGQQLQTALHTALENLHAALRQWEERYLLRAPQAGAVSFLDFWTEHQFVKAGQAVMSIIPAQTQPAVGRLRVPVQNFGKVAIGQPVQVYLDNYPYEEYGRLKGVVRTISSLPKQGYYSVTATFPQGLTTQYGQAIPFQQQLQGQAEIITEELRLMERIFQKLRNISTSLRNSS